MPEIFLYTSMVIPALAPAFIKLKGMITGTRISKTPSPGIPVKMGVKIKIQTTIIPVMVSTPATSARTAVRLLLPWR